MKILRLKLRGFIGIKKGLGADEIELNLEHLKGLTALSGENGQGKTTVIENLHPFRSLPSRKRALQYHVETRDAVKELDFILDGDTYRTVLKIDCQSGRQEAFIYKNDNEKSETNGKVKEYDKYIKKLLGSETLFFNSVFCAQNSDKLSDLTTAELKKLFAEFLRLDKLQAHEKTSKEAIGILTNRKVTLEKDLEKVVEKLAGLNKISEEMAALEHSKDIEENKIEPLNARLVNLNADLEKERNLVSDSKAAQGKIDMLLKQSADLEAGNREDKEEIEKELVLLRHKLAGILKKIEAVDVLLEKKDAILTAESDREEKLTTIKKHQKDLEQLQKDFEDTVEAESKTSAEKWSFTDSKLSQLAEYQKTDLIIKGRMKDHETAIKYNKGLIANFDNDPDLSMLYNIMSGLTEKITGLDGLDCQNKACPFIQSALKAEKEIEETDGRIKAREKEIEENKLELVRIIESDEESIRIRAIELTELKDKIGVLTAENEKKRAEFDYSLKTLEENKNALSIKISQKNDLIGLISDQIKALDEIIAKKDEIIKAESEREYLVEIRSETRYAGLKLKRDLEDRHDSRREKITGLDLEIIKIKQTIDPEAPQRMNSVVIEISEIQECLKKCESSVIKMGADIDNLKKSVADLGQSETFKAVVESDLRELSIELTAWTYLKNACSKNGLQALEIDSVLPGITENANNLLRAAFGGSTSTVTFDTLDEDGKECFSIKIIDEDGEEVLLENRSGGQKVWPIKATMLAMTMISREKSGRNFQTFFADEEDGPLDPENAKNFISLYKHMLNGGGFDNCFYISHKPECVALADNQMVFGGGEVVIR